MAGGCTCVGGAWLSRLGRGRDVSVYKTYRQWELTYCVTNSWTKLGFYEGRVFGVAKAKINRGMFISLVCVYLYVKERWLIREWSATCAPSRIYCRRWYCETDIISAFSTVTTAHALTTLAANFKRWRFPRLAVKQLAPSTYNWRKTLAMYFTGQVLSIISFSFFIPGAARSSALYSAIFSRARSVVESGI